MEKISVFGAIGMIILAVIGGGIILLLSLIKDGVLGALFFGLFSLKRKLEEKAAY